MKRAWGWIPILVFAGFAAVAQDKPCSPADARAAEKVVDRVVNWDHLYRAFQEYRHCDKGPVEEIFTEALLRCIVEWKNVEGLARPMEKDKDYRDFVFRHLGSPAAKPDLEAVYSRAKMSCPKGLDPFCEQIAAAVKPLAGMETSLQPMQSMSPAPAPAPAQAPPKK